jgi:regulator of RNase E activity RraA
LSTAELFDQLRQFDTPTICNALEVVRGERFTHGFTRRRLLAAKPNAPAIVGFARTAMIRTAEPFDPAGRRERLFAYYAHIESGPETRVAVIQDLDDPPGLGAFWGEVNTTVHWGLGCVGAITNGSMRDLDAMHPNFQCLAGSLSPSHAHVQVVEHGKPVNVLGMLVKDGDVVHADRHGAVTFEPALLERIPAAIDLMARREKVILDVARQPGLNAQKIRAAYAAMEQVK